MPSRQHADEIVSADGYVVKRAVMRVRRTVTTPRPGCAGTVPTPATAYGEASGPEVLESAPVLRGRMQHKRAELRAQVSEALQRRAGTRLDPFTADLLTSAAGAALESVAREFRRSRGQADREALTSQAFARLRPRL